MVPDGLRNEPMEILRTYTAYPSVKHCSDLGQYVVLVG